MKKTLFFFILSIILFSLGLTTISADTEQKEHSDKLTKHYKNSIFKLTDKGFYSVEMVLKSGALKKGKNNIDIIVHDAEDHDVIGANIKVTPRMPGMEHGVGEEPTVIERGGGLYSIENINLTMGGHWELIIIISKNSITDTATFDFPAVASSEPKKHQHIKRPDVIDISTTQISEKGLYRVSYIPSIQPLRINTIHEWKVRITDISGNPIAGARIKIEGDMPEHGHGLPTEPEVVEELPGGEYIIDGMKFQMPGWWVVKLHIHSPAGMDTVTFQLDID
jgi:hypothetical protein